MVKISLIGAGSGVFTGIVRTICMSQHLSGSIISLMDINQERLDMTYDICCRYTKEIGTNLRFEKTTNQLESLKGADFIINTALTAPHHRLLEGWKIADKYGFDFAGSHHVKSDEAFWINFYQLRFFEELTQDILSHCPNAWHLMVANPVFAGTTYIQRKYPEAKMVGLCHGYNGANTIAEMMGYNRDDFTFQLAGVNHFLWLNKGNIKDRDFFDVLEERLADPNPENNPLGKIPAEFYKRHGVVGIGDTLLWSSASWPWFCNADEETKREFNDIPAEKGWSEYFDWVAKSSADIIEVAKDKSRSAKEFLETVWTDDLVVPLVESLACNIPRLMHVNLLNRGGIVQGLPDDIGIEVQALCQRNEIRPIKSDPLPRTVIAYILRDRVAPLEMELEAFRAGRLAYLEELVLMDKWATSIKQVRGFLNEILDLPYHADMKAHYCK